MSPARPSYRAMERLPIWLLRAAVAGCVQGPDSLDIGICGEVKAPEELAEFLFWMHSDARSEGGLVPLSPTFEETRSSNTVSTVTVPRRHVRRLSAGLSNAALAAR